MHPFKLQYDNWINCYLVIEVDLAARASFPDRLIKEGWPGARLGQIEASFPHHIHDADATDKRSKTNADRKIRVF
jgi:hypothetical protein